MAEPCGEGLGCLSGAPMPAAAQGLVGVRLRAQLAGAAGPLGDLWFPSLAPFL